jgi:hypothetical protein
MQYFSNLFYAYLPVIICIQSAIMRHNSNFKFMNFKKVQKYIHNGSWIVHKNVRGLMVKIVFESDTSLRNYHEKMEETILMYPIVHHVLYSNFKFWRRRNRLCVLRVRSPCSMHCSHVNYTLLTTDSMHLIGHHVPGFKFERRQGYLHVEKFLCGNKINFYSSNH